MLKSFILILGSSFLLGLSAVGVHNYLENQDFGQHGEWFVDSPEEKMASLVSRLDFSEQRVEVLSAYNKALLERNRKLTDSIRFLQVEIASLNRHLSVQRGNLKVIQGNLQTIEDSYNSLKSEIARLSRQASIDREKINKLEKEKSHLRLQISALHEAQEAEQAEQARVEQLLEEKRMKEDRYLQLASILNQTNIRFQKITLLKKRYGKPLLKINKNDNNWKYTVIEFFMDHQDIKMLLDQQFVIKIVDSDTNEILSFVEANPSFPQSEGSNNGISFHFDGNLVELTYHNNERKAGKNYELQLFYRSPEGKEYLLVNGIHSIINNRRSKGA
ncbi:MAG: hypothetical protein AAFV95_26705 [Bacteroidota bacterium]